MPGVEFLSRLHTNESDRVIGSWFNTSHHLKMWKNAHITPWTTQVHFPNANMQEGKSQLEDGRLSLIKPSPFGNPALDERMEKMAAEVKPRKVKRWLEALSHKHTVKQIASWLSDD